MKVVAKTHHIYSFSPDLQPVLTVASGDEVVFETYDCYREQLKAPSRNQMVALQGLNPATGPVAVHGVVPGDTLKITVISIDLDEEGTMYLRPGAGILRKYVAEPEVKKFRVEGGKVHFNEKHALAVKPMIGVIGVSPKSGDITTYSPGTHGGNMDTKEIVEGAVVYLPVSVDGANLAIGDLHALMGDGEAPVCGVEIGGRVRVKVEVVKGQCFVTPVVEDREQFYVVASATTMDEACQLATEYMFEFLRERLEGYEANEIVCLMGISGDLRVSQMVNPLKTAKFAIPKAVFDVTFEINRE
ncbi:acetamidase/formamidase family protein [Brevibacillus centrosporus]|uniref:acetamidase/formamidase family protein n=1 Tax=Brevibacillus centrosporus TaxID=54910 RepID=UPI00381D2E4B